MKNDEKVMNNSLVGKLSIGVKFWGFPEESNGRILTDNKNNSGEENDERWWNFTLGNWKVIGGEWLVFKIQGEKYIEYVF